MLSKAELEILTKPKVRKFIREKMGEWEFGDQYLIENVDTIFCNPPHREDDWWNDKAIIRIPLAIDHRNPERGIIEGMLQNFIGIVKTSSGLWDAQIGSTPEAFLADTPYLALLRALDKQIGGE